MKLEEMYEPIAVDLKTLERFWGSGQIHIPRIHIQPFDPSLHQLFTA